MAYTNERDDTLEGSVPTSHYHLPLRQVIIIVLICAVLVALVSAYFLFDVSNSETNIEQSPMGVGNTPVAPVYPENSLSFVYPPEYEIVETDASGRTEGTLAEYVFTGGTGDPQLPALFDVVIHTADSIVAGGLSVSADEFDREKVSFEQKEDIAGWNMSVFNDRTFYVQNMETESRIPRTFRRYVTFVGDTRLGFRIEMPSSSESMQADELFRQVYIVLNR